MTAITSSPPAVPGRTPEDGRIWGSDQGGVRRSFRTARGKLCRLAIMLPGTESLGLAAVHSPSTGWAISDTGKSARNRSGKTTPFRRNTAENNTRSVRPVGHGKRPKAGSPSGNCWIDPPRPGSIDTLFHHGDSILARSQPLPHGGGIRRSCWRESPIHRRTTAARASIGRSNRK